MHRTALKNEKISTRQPRVINKIESYLKAKKQPDEREA